MPEPRGIRGDRLVRPGGIAPLSRVASVGLLRPCRETDLRGAGRLRNLGRGTRTALASTPTARHQEDAPRRAAAPNEPVRLSARPLACPLGPTRTRCRGQVSDLDE